MTDRYAAPYINFQGRAREAMEHYHKALGGRLDLVARDEKGQPRPAGPEDSIMHARLESGGILILGSDGSPQFHAKVGENVAIVLGGKDRESIAKAFELLSEGGIVKMGLTKMPWGEAAWFTDKFGINWNVDIEPS